MTITSNDIKLFKALYVTKFNIELTDDLARKKLSTLVRQVEIIYQPITMGQLRKLKDLNGNEHNELLPAK
jgi:hypothetical protein